MSASHLASHVVRHKQGRRSIQRTHGRLNARLMRDFVMRWAIWAVATSAYASAHAHVHKGRPLGVHQYPTPHSCAAGARTCAHTMPHSILWDRTACPAGSPLGRQRRKQPPPPHTSALKCACTPRSGVGQHGMSRSRMGKQGCFHWHYQGRRDYQGEARSSQLFGRNRPPQDAQLPDRP